MVTVVGVPPPDQLPGGWGPNAVTVSIVKLHNLDHVLSWYAG